MKKILFISSLFMSFLFYGQNFKIIPLGVGGGVDESNLSTYLISDSKSDKYLSLDAGTLYSGIRTYLTKNNINEDPIGFLQDNIAGYFISHRHFDHVNGIIISSPSDKSKNIYSIPLVIESFKKHIFSWETWANFGNEGEKPVLNKYKYQPLVEKQWIDIENTNLKLKTFYLSHAGESLSSAALLQNSEGNYFLYLGDTGADKIEKTSQLSDLWKEIAPIINEGKFKGMIIECSYANEHPLDQLFGHLKPELLIEELSKLENTVSNKNKLKNLSVIITHIKPKPGNLEKIKEELTPLNKKGIKIIFPKQGEIINL